MQKAYSWLHYSPLDFPVARRVAAQIVSLPMYPQLTAEQQTQVANEMRNFACRFAPAREDVIDMSLSQRSA
jgi:dTDP-4-amino-4,6-dideoxygalactose transaminase